MILHYKSWRAKNYWDNKYPKKIIHYLGRTLANKPTARIPVPVQVFVTPYDSVIRRDIEDNNLQVPDPYKINEHVIKIFRHTRNKPLNPYHYEHDNHQFNIDELWLFPYELRHAGKGDCDDWGAELASYYIAAGIPRWRVRVVVGTCRLGGHFTVYVLADDFKTWYHTNSTDSQVRVDNLTQLPKTDAHNDDFGITKVWFSFNDHWAWHGFNPEITEEMKKWDVEVQEEELKKA